ncbi:MAG: polysaccharide biosynthesis protein [Actinobacteria bacterium]|nr:polysaccharide biosynthesis protein [Actinomycetota bacterium]
MSRLDFAKRNVRYGYLATFVAIILGFVSRTVFIQELGINYLGVNGLFTNVLGILSFAELGIGSAMNYSLYKPVAENDTKTIRSLMQFYKRVYRVIALAVTVLGMSLLPFLDRLVTDPGDVGDIAVYYVIFLFNSVVSYFVVYKLSLINAEQKNYVVSNFNTAASLITVSAQIIALVLFGSYLGYLLVMAAMRVSQQIALNIFLNRRYPSLLKGPADPLPREQLSNIKTNIAALVWHRIGDISVHQTDNIVISAFINVATVGLVSNYNLIITSVTTLINVAVTSVISSFGNLFAVESRERQYEVFKVYRFIAFWAYGFSAIALFTLLTPFIVLWLGSDFVIAEVVILLIVANFYMLGQRIVVNNIKSAAGFWGPDKYLALIQAGVNLIVSVALVREIGLIGVYIGTITQGLLATIIKPVLVYRRLFHVPSRAYFLDGLRYAVPVVLVGAVCWFARTSVGDSISVLEFALLMAGVAVVPNVVFLLLFWRTPEFRYVTQRIMGRG